MKLAYLLGKNEPNGNRMAEKAVSQLRLGNSEKRPAAKGVNQPVTCPLCNGHLWVTGNIIGCKTSRDGVHRFVLRDVIPASPIKTGLSDSDTGGKA